MSRILWSHALIPSAAQPAEERVYDVGEPPLSIRRTRSFPEPDRDLVELPDRRAYRSLSRTGVLLLAAGLPAAETLAPFLEADPYRAGIYAALTGGPQNYQACKELLGVRETFAEDFRRLNSPKRYFTMLANLPAAQLGIFLDLRGPINVYVHSTAAVGQALEQAEVDLADGVVDAALVCAAFSLDDPLLSLRTRSEVPETRVLSEGAAALVLGRGDGEKDWDREILEATGESSGERSSAGEAYYGIADPLLAFLERGRGVRRRDPR